MPIEPVSVEKAVVDEATWTGALVSRLPSRNGSFEWLPRSQRRQAGACQLVRSEAGAAERGLTVYSLDVFFFAVFFLAAFFLAAFFLVFFFAFFTVVFFLVDAFFTLTCG